MQKYKELQDIIAILGMDELSDEDKKEYDAKKEAYEKVKANYIGKNKAAQITL